MKKMYVMTQSGKILHNHAIASIIIAEDNEKNNKELRLYRDANGFFILDDIKFVFSQDFIDILNSIYIDKFEETKYGTIIIANFILQNNSNINEDCVLMFKLNENKKEINFWNDLDYIMENMVEKWSNLYYPMIKQVSDITKLTLGRI